MIEEYRRRLIIMLQLAQFDKPLPLLIARTSQSLEQVSFYELIQCHSYISRLTPASLVPKTPIPLTRPCDVLG